MHDWASFFFTGSNVLPVVMVLSNETTFDLAIFVYLGLLFVACFMALRDEQSPARQAMAAELERRRKSKKRD